MATKRTYGESCAAAHALDLVGDRWALLVVRELVLGPKRFTDLREGILRASPNVLTERLRELEKAGVVRRRRLPPPTSASVYELTEWGAELEAVLQQLGHWGARSPLRPPDAGMSLDAFILALRTMFSAEAAGDLDATYELLLNGEPFTGVVRGGEFELERGEASDPDATLECDFGTLAGVIFERRPLVAAMRSGDLKLEGNRKAVTRFLGLFPMPALATIAA